MRFIRDNGQRLWWVWDTRAGHLCGKPTEKFRALVCVCVCVFVDLTSASLFWCILVLFPHKLSLIFQTPGTSNGIEPYHISHSAGGWGAAIRNRVTVHSSNRRSCPSVFTFLISAPSFHRHWAHSLTHTLSLPVTNQIIRSPNLFKLSLSIPQPKKGVYHSTRLHGGHTHLVWTVTVFQMVGLRTYPIKWIVTDEILRRSDSPVEDLAGGISPSSIL